MCKDHKKISKTYSHYYFQLLGGSAYARYKLVRFFQSDHASLYPVTSVMCKDSAPQYGNLAE